MTLHDKKVSTASVVGVVLWVTATVAVLGVWVAAVTGVSVDFEVAIGATAALALTAACTWQVRRYTLRLCALIRVGAGLERPAPELHSVDTC